MKKNRTLVIITAVCVVITLTTVALAATGGLEEIKAYLNRSIGVYYNGELQRMTDANGKEVYPISYQGTTYVPIRAVSNMLGIDVEWDGTTKSVLLGQTGVEKDLIENFTPYAKDRCYHYKTSDGKVLTLGDKKYYHGLDFDVDSHECYYLSYDLGGKYTTFSFTSYYECDYYSDSFIKIYGDNDTLLGIFEMKSGNLPKTFSVDVTGVQQLTIRWGWESTWGWNGYGAAYILDAKIK